LPIWKLPVAAVRLAALEVAGTCRVTKLAFAVRLSTVTLVVELGTSFWTVRPEEKSPEHV
jgi:hypothetical protein